MITLALYAGPKRVAEYPLSPNQVLPPLAEALNAWCATAASPRVVLEQGNAVRIVRLPAQAVA